VSSSQTMQIQSVNKLPLLPRDLALIALFAAFIAVLGMLGMIPLGPVAITFQSMGVMMTGSLLGTRRSLNVIMTFIALVLAGLPLLAGGRGGVGILFSPSIGYLFGWIPGVLVIAWLAPKQPSKFLFIRFLIANLIGGIVVIYSIGLPVAAWRLDNGLLAIMLSAIEFLPGDIVKAVIVSLVATSLFRAYRIPPAGLR